jgi:hypothetical protein
MYLLELIGENLSLLCDCRPGGDAYEVARHLLRRFGDRYVRELPDTVEVRLADARVELVVPAGRRKAREFYIEEEVGRFTLAEIRNSPKGGASCPS